MAAALLQQIPTALRPARPRAVGEEGMMGALARMAEAVGAPPTRLMGDFAALSLGPGRIAFSDYDELRLYDDAFWGGADRRAVVGRRRARELCLQANYRRDCFGLAANRLAGAAYLAAHGLPAAPIEAIYREGLATPGAHVLRTRDELRRFLEERNGEPLVGRPVEGGRARTLACRTPAQIDRLVDALADTPAAGYLFHPKIAPHPEIAAVAAGALPQIRLVTLATDQGPKVFRAVWKLPEHLAQLDLRTGQVLRVTPRPGTPAAERRGSERTVALLGARIPDWCALKAATVEAARLIGELALIGWDIAPGADGPVILGFTPTPGLVSHQFVERRGVLDADFTAFIETQRRYGAEYAEQTRALADWD